MNKPQYNQLQTAAIDEAINSLVDQFPQLLGREVRIRSILTKLQHSSASNTRAYELLGLRTSDELAQLWAVTNRRVAAHCKMLHEQWGIGRKIGKSWVLSADEADHHRPTKAGAPMGNKNNPYGKKGKT